MADGAGQAVETSADQRMQALIATLRHVGTPLLLAISEAGGAARQGQAVTEDPAQTARDAGQFGALVESTVVLAQMIVEDLLDNDEISEDWVRWGVIQAASQVVAAHFRATARALSAEEAKPILALLGELQGKFKYQIMAASEPTANSVATFRAKAIEALVPVVGAVAQYSFGRAEHALVAEVAERLMKTADQITRSLAEGGSTPEQWRLLCWSVLRSAGQIYAESHYAEADRLLYMNPDERAAYFTTHGNIVPMNRVWQAFNQRMGMLATLAAYLEVPASARLDEQGWG